MGVGAGSLASLVRVGGTLTKPSAKPDVGNLAATGARVAGAVASGGLSVLAEGLLSKGSGDEPPCQIALGKVQPAATGTGAEQTPAAGSDTPQDPAKELLDGLKGLLKR